MHRTPSILALVVAAAAACDPNATATEPDLDSPGGKAEFPGKQACGDAAEVESLVMRYWMSWQDDDYELFRSTLADDVRVDLGFVQVEGADAITEISAAGHPFREVRMIAADFHADAATIVYTAIDDVTNQPIRMSELIAVRDGLITAVTGVLLAGPAPRASVNVPYDEEAFAPFDPAHPDGPRVQLLWGELATGMGMLIYTTRDMPASSHSHTSAYHGVVLQGVVRNGPDITKTPDMGPGSYWAQAGGENHITQCMSEEPCISLVMFDGGFDLVPE